MSVEWSLQWAANGVLTGAGWLLCLYLFLSLKRELQRGGARASRRQEALSDEIASLTNAIDRLDTALVELSHRSELLVEPPPAASGLNINKRSQALRMHRRGESSANIAAALAMPQLEVDLLLKVEQIGAGKE